MTICTSLLDELIIPRCIINDTFTVYHTLPCVSNTHLINLYILKETLLVSNIYTTFTYVYIYTL